jgi:dihydrodipicolinate synthase/N-acetylneuraminate lyase
MARSLPPNYETKFAEFIRMCRDAKTSGLKVIVVAHPSVIGDTYEEIIESLSRLAEADLSFHAAKPEPELQN